MRKVTCAFWLGLALITTLVWAATDGTQGTTSSGTTIISITKVNNVRLTGVNDINFGSISSAPPNGSTYDSVCVYSTLGDYTVTATSANEGGTGFFRLRYATTYITYTVLWNNADSGSTGTNLFEGDISGRFTGANTTSNTCNGVMNARYFVNLTPSAVTVATPGTYADTLTFVVAPY